MSKNDVLVNEEQAGDCVREMSKNITLHVPVTVTRAEYKRLEQRANAFDTTVINILHSYLPLL